MTKYNKNYAESEIFSRRAAYYQSKARIATLSARAKARGLNTQFGINQFSDLFPEDFARLYKGYKPSDKSAILPMDSETVYATSIPTSWDWRNQNAVTPVKDQGQCGSCWAFSATEGVESAWYLAKKQTVILAPQQVVSCDTVDGGCNGGDLPTAFAYIQANGMESETAYPYTSGESGANGNCNFNSQQVIATISGFKYATQNSNETQMQEAMIPNGPLSICVDASTWQDYTGGIIENNCQNSLDHCVQLVGWNTDSGVPYWIVRNSWNTNWGINGYIYVERNQDLCGIADEATYAVI